MELHLDWFFCWKNAVPTWSVTHWCLTLRLKPTRLLCPMGFSRQEYWDGLPFTSPGDLPDPGIEHAPLVSPAFCRQILYHWVTRTASECCFRKLIHTPKETHTAHYLPVPNTQFATVGSCTFSQCQHIFITHCSSLLQRDGQSDL